MAPWPPPHNSAAGFVLVFLLLMFPLLFPLGRGRRRAQAEGFDATLPPLSHRARAGALSATVQDAQRYSTKRGTRYGLDRLSWGGRGDGGGAGGTGSGDGGDGGLGGGADLGLGAGGGGDGLELGEGAQEAEPTRTCDPREEDCSDCVAPACRVLSWAEQPPLPWAGGSSPVARSLALDDGASAGCVRGDWPAAAGGTLIRGSVLRVFPETEPCAKLPVFSAKMRNRHDVVAAATRCAEDALCDGVAVYEQELRCEGFRFGSQGGRDANLWRATYGVHTVLKDGAGDCGAHGRSAPPGECLPLAALAPAAEASAEGVVTVRGHEPCGATLLRFRNTGLPAAAFPRPTVMATEPGAPPDLCVSLCRDDNRCDGVVAGDGYCSLFAAPGGGSGQPAPMRPAADVDTLLVRRSAAAAVGLIDVLRAHADPAAAPPEEAARRGEQLPGLTLRLWDQADDEEGYVETLANDGLAPGAEYAVTLEGEAAGSSDLRIAAGWDPAAATAVRVRKTGEADAGGFTPAALVAGARFSVRRLTALDDAVWFRDPAGRRARQAPAPAPGAALKGTRASFSGGLLSLSRDAGAGPASDWASGAIVLGGSVLAAGPLPTEAEFLEALNLSGVYARRAGASYSWEPAGEPRYVSWTSGDAVVLDRLALPPLGPDSVVAVYRLHAGEYILVSRASGADARDAPPPPPPPLGYDAWLTDAPPAALGTAAGAGDVAACARACDARPAGDCTAFSLDGDGGCRLHAWAPDAERRRVTPLAEGTRVYHRAP